MLSQYARQYQQLFEDHWWWQSRRRFILRRLATLAAQRPLGRILDIGCGNGLLFDLLSAHGQVHGIEPDPELVPRDSPWRDRIEIASFSAVYAGPAAQLAPFDLVLMLDVLEHIEDDAGALRRVGELLRPGGHLLLTVPALMALWSRHDVANQHFRRYGRRELRRRLQQAGFQVRSLHYYFGWAVGPMLLRRLLAPAGGDGGGAHTVRIPSPAVNRLLYRLSCCEQWVWGPWGPPVGSSLFALAGKG